MRATASGCSEEVAIRRVGLLLLFLWSCSPREPSGEIVADGPEGGVERALGTGEVHRYRLKLGAGQFLRLVVDQQGVDAVVTLEAPDGALLLRADRPINDLGPELVLAVAETAGDYGLSIGAGEPADQGRYRVRVELLRVATPRDRRLAETYRRFTAASDLADDAKEAEWNAALAAFRELGETALAGEALIRLGMKQHIAARYDEAAELNAQATEAFVRAAEPRWEAIARTNLGSSLVGLGKAEDAMRELKIAVPLARDQHDPTTLAQALQSLGQAQQNLGELQQALDHYEEALKLFSPSDQVRRANTLHALGVLHARFLGDLSRGQELLLLARDSFSAEWAARKATTLSQLGRLAYEQTRLDEARRHFEEALALRQERDCSSAVFLARLALVEQAQGAPQAAAAHLGEALAVAAAQDCPRSGPTVQRLAAELAGQRGETASERDFFAAAVARFVAQGDRLAEAECLHGLAGAERRLGDLPAALAASRRALEILEGVRPTVLREDLRTSFFSSAHPAFDTHIDLLLATGAAEEAWAFAEQSRSRGLRDLLAEAGARLRAGADPALFERELQLQRQLNALESQRSKTGERGGEKLAALNREIDRVMAELESARGEMRRANPKEAALTAAERPSLAEVRRELLDDDTLLLEVRLGEAASTLWALSRERLEAFPLPPRSVLEPLARVAVRWQQSLEWSGENPPAFCELSRQLLAPVGSLASFKRLVVVADGGLEALAFAALPEPGDPAHCARARPLVASHEIVHLPSAATLLAQRRLTSGRRPAPLSLAVLADSTYRPDGPWRRLPRAGAEAAAIVAALPPEKALLARGAAASRRLVLDGSLRDYRILHFATHGRLDAERPLLSALALAELDETGQPVEGELRAHEIYNLDLPAELVVLSACETALGREVAGEGLVAGLPRAFLYAGAARVLVSLWEVEDESTRELMELFYQGLLARHLPPAEALAEAQRALLAAGREPHQWAAFVLWGDWRALPP